MKIAYLYLLFPYILVRFIYFFLCLIIFFVETLKF